MSYQKKKKKVELVLVSSLKGVLKCGNILERFLLNFLKIYSLKGKKKAFVSIVLRRPHSPFSDR